ncbi:MAG: sigma-70 family RNA polymerase sigma factor [Nannocystaceae bacterium]
MSRPRVMPDDEELLARWRRGDTHSGEVLVERHFPRLYRFFRGRLDHDVADLVQRTFLACVAARDRVPVNASFGAYLTGIAHNQLLMHLRTLRRRRVVAAEQGTNEGRSPSPSPSQVVGARERQDLVLRAIRGLPVAQQVTLQLRYWDQMTVPEIAHALDIPPGTVKSRLHSALERLRSRLIELTETPHRSGGKSGYDIERWIGSLRGFVVNPAETPA